MTDSETQVSLAATEVRRTLAVQLSVAPTGPREWSGRCEIGARDRLFGGQVVAQALVAAATDLGGDGFDPRSVHGHFLRAGASGVPVTYRVSSLTDGRSFATRQVQAVQREAGQPERVIATAVVAFHRPETSSEHQVTMPAVPPPESNPAAPVPPSTNPRVRAPFELRSVSDADAADPTKRQLWVRTRESLGTDQVLVAAALTWIADFNLPWSTDAPHTAEPGARTGASLDHTLWFHQPVTLDHWLLLDQTSPVYTGARGLSFGHFYRTDGAMVATAVQESMIRRSI